MDVIPQKENLETVFSSGPFYIDFYQRQYKWTKDPVRRLLDDIFYKFNIEYQASAGAEADWEQRIEKYAWYYLNTYVTSIVAGKKFIVDGQQRLTTLMLILIKLRHLAQKTESKLADWIDGRIAGTSGFKKKFLINHDGCDEIVSSLYENDYAGDYEKNIGGSSMKPPSGVTAHNLVANYKHISESLSRELAEKTKFEGFVFYFLRRLVLINLNVETLDVPMIFEVINDRGVRLKPYEILKGKLLGQIDKAELSALNLDAFWEKQVEALNAGAANTHNPDKENEIDKFFKYYLKAKFAKNSNEANEYDHDYHRHIFSNKVNEQLKLRHNAEGVTDFLQHEFHYFTELYLKMLTYRSQPHADFMHVYYNGLNNMNQQFLLLLSACKYQDAEEAKKIQVVCYQFDRLYLLLSLQGCYKSNTLNEAVYKISAEIRHQAVQSIPKVFQKVLLQILSKTLGNETKDSFSYSRFKETGYNMYSLRYFLARIEEFIAKHTNMNMKHDLRNLANTRGGKNGFHIEHILSYNDANMKLFDNDKERFENERNRLGGLLLLKGRDNISSSNETFANKLKTYANTLHWNETLLADSYKSKLDFEAMMQKFQLEFRALEKFGPSELEDRHRLLFAIATHIWK